MKSAKSKLSGQAFHIRLQPGVTRYEIEAKHGIVIFVEKKGQTPVKVSGMDKSGKPFRVVGPVERVSGKPAAAKPEFFPFCIHITIVIGDLDAPTTDGLIFWDFDIC